MTRTAPAARRLTDGPVFRNFCASYVVQTKGRWARQPLLLEPWQGEFSDELLEIDPDTGLRVYQEGLLGIPKKNGKSTLGSAIGLYLLGMDGEAEPEVYAGAAAKGQARIVMGQARAMVRRSPALLDVFRPWTYHIECPDNGGIFRVVSSDAALQQGINPSGAIIDELHAHKNAELYTALTNASGAREQPLAVTITTAGVDESSILGTIYNRALTLPDVERRGALTIVRDRANGFLMYWYGADDSADIDDPGVWRACNPASWLQDGEYLRRQRFKPSMLENEFRRYHLNQWVANEEAWLSKGVWEACESPIVDRATERRQHELDRRRPIGVGIDKGGQHDSSAVVVAQRQGENVVVRANIWANPYPPSRSEHSGWIVQAAWIRDYLRELRSRFPVAQVEIDDQVVPGPAFAYDPWQFKESAEILEQDGFAMIQFPQNASHMGPATALTMELIKSGRLRHDGDPVLAQHVRNATARLMERGPVIFKRKGTSKKNDAAVALVMAVAMAMQEPPSRDAEAFYSW